MWRRLRKSSIFPGRFGKYLRFNIFPISFRGVLRHNFKTNLCYTCIISLWPTSPRVRREGTRGINRENIYGGNQRIPCFNRITCLGRKLASYTGIISVRNQCKPLKILTSVTVILQELPPSWEGIPSNWVSGLCSFYELAPKRSSPRKL